MPVYTYNCTHCGYGNDDKRDMENRDRTTICGDCGNLMVRVITPPAVKFVGDGFYSNEK